jgi:CDP-glucose 4,6-dehydratase
MIDLSFFRGKKVFITGHTGFKGTWLSHVLLFAGADVTGYALEPNTEPSLFKLSGLEEHISSIYGDVRNLDALQSAMNKAQPEIVFHLAAQPLVRLSYKEPVLTYETNVMGTVNVLEAVRHTASVRSVVNVTTDKVYENKEWHWGYRENENLCGFDPYSNSKSCSELVTYSYRNSFFSTKDAPALSTARSGNVIGGGDYAEDRIIPDCVRATQKGESIKVRNPNSIRPYQHVLECLFGYLNLAEKQWFDKSLCGAYNFGPDDESCVSTGTLVELFCQSWQGATWMVQGDGGPHEANFLKLDCSKAKANLNWKPKLHIKEAIEMVVAWYERVNLNSPVQEVLNAQIKKYQIL